MGGPVVSGIEGAPVAANQFSRKLSETEDDHAETANEGESQVYTATSDVSCMVNRRGGAMAGEINSKPEMPPSPWSQLPPSGLQQQPPRQGLLHQGSMSKQQGFNYYPNLPSAAGAYDYEQRATQRIQEIRAKTGTTLEFSIKGAYRLEDGDGMSDHMPSAPTWEHPAWRSPGSFGDMHPAHTRKDSFSGDSALHFAGQNPKQQELQSSTVVHMTRSDAWARFAAYEACIQVCCENATSESSKFFRAHGFQALKDSLKVGSLLLTGQPQMGWSDDIYWHDSSSEARMVVMDDGKGGASQLHAHMDHTVHVRIAGIMLPGMNMLERFKRWASKRHPAQEARRTAAVVHNKRLVVYFTCPDGNHMLQCPVDKYGCPIMTGQSSWTGLEVSTGEIKVDVHSREGRLACGSVMAEELWHLAQQVEVMDRTSETGEAPGDTGHASRYTTSMHVSLASGSSPGQSIGQLIVEVQRVRRHPLELGLAEAPRSVSPGGQPGVGGAQLDLGSTKMGGPAGQAARLNRNISYDFLLSSALEQEKCGPGRLTLEGNWQWLLTAFADHYNVSNPYRVLIHLQWMLQPSIARTSSLCLTTMYNSWSYLMDCKTSGHLTPQEDTLLTRARKDIEELLKVAFIRYYIPQQEDEQDDEQPKQYELHSWDAQHLQAAVQLYQVVAPFLQPSPHDWLALCWQTAAQKRWKTLMALGDPDHLLAGELQVDNKADAQWAGGGSGIRRRPPLNSGMRSAGDIKVYQLVVNLCRLIQDDITFDLHLKREPGLLPPEPDLPRKTAEEYLGEFLDILTVVLSTYPPTSPSPQAVDLLVAVASMQRYLDVAGLQCDAQHPLHLNAYQLFQPHVVKWISASQQRLSQQCQQLENSSKGPHAQGMVLGQGNSCPLVITMMHAINKELLCYERVLQHWPRFVPCLEAGLCRVLRGALGTLSRLCETVKGDATPVPSDAPTPTPNHQRSATALPAVGNQFGGSGASLAANAPGKRGLNSAMSKISMHRRNASAFGAMVSDAPLVSQKSYGPLLTRVDEQGKGAGGLQGRAAGPGGKPRMVVLLKEAVLLNSLKHIMVMVPEMEDSLTQWATWSAGQAPLTSEGQQLPDGVDIGVHFAQLVKELRTGYATAVATCAGRLAEVLRSVPSTNIRVALEPTNKPVAAEYGNPYHQQVSSATAQRQALDEALAPVLAGIQEALAALQETLDTRVCVATGRALWDYVGKDLHLFVSALQENSASETPQPAATSAWRARQNADMASQRIDDLFRQMFTDILNGAVQPCDLQPPAHMDKVHKLLQRNSAAANMAFIPF